MAALFKLVLCGAVLGSFAVSMAPGPESSPGVPASPLVFATRSSVSSSPAVFAVDPADGETRQVFAGYGWRPHVSPDGRFVFLGTEDGFAVVRTDGSGEQRLLDSSDAEPGRWYETVWSPDSDAVAWVSGRQLVIASPASGELQQIALPRSSRYSVHWSTDNRRLALQSRTGCGTAPGALYLADPLAGNVHIVLDGIDLPLVAPAWSNDGRSLAAVVVSPGCTTRGGNPPALVVVDTATLAVDVLADDFDGFSLAWDPDGTAVRSLSKVGRGRLAIQSVPGQGGPVSQLTQIDANNSVVWSPDRTHITWMTSDRTPGVGELWVLDVGDPQAQRLATDVLSSGDEVWPKWSPDGAWIAFTRGSLDLSGGSGAAMWIVRADGTDERELVDAGYNPDLGDVDW